MFQYDTKFSNNLKIRKNVMYFNYFIYIKIQVHWIKNEGLNKNNKIMSIIFILLIILLFLKIIYKLRVHNDDI